MDNVEFRLQDHGRELGPQLLGDFAPDLARVPGTKPHALARLVGSQGSVQCLHELIATFTLHTKTAMEWVWLPSAAAEWSQSTRGAVA